MKKLIIIAVLIAFPFGLQAQESGFDKLIKKYDGRKGITAINLEGSILEGLTYFLQQFDKEDDVPYAMEMGVEEEVAPPAETEIEVVAAADGEDEETTDYKGYTEYEYVYGETGDYDYDNEAYIPYGMGSSEWSGYLGMFKSYLDGLTFLKAIVYENPDKKFAKTVQKTVVAKKPYKSIVSMHTDSEDVSLYMIDDEASGKCEILAMVRSGNQFVVANIMGSRDFKTLIDGIKSFL